MFECSLIDIVDDAQSVHLLEKVKIIKLKRTVKNDEIWRKLLKNGCNVLSTLRPSHKK